MRLPIVDEDIQAALFAIGSDAPKYPVRLGGFSCYRVGITVGAEWIAPTRANKYHAVAAGLTVQRWLAGLGFRSADVTPSKLLHSGIYDIAVGATTFRVHVCPEPLDVRFFPFGAVYSSGELIPLQHRWLFACSYNDEDGQPSYLCHGLCDRSVMADCEVRNGIREADSRHFTEPESLVAMLIG